jgi:hypothetical protein
MTGLDRSAIGMREVSPFGGILPQDERDRTLRQVRNAARPVGARYSRSTNEAAMSWSSDA